MRSDRTLRPPCSCMRPLLTVLSLLLAAHALAQEMDPFESRFRMKPKFQIKFRVPEKGGEVRLYTRNPVHYEKDLFWEGSEEVLIEYQDVRITADSAHYDFPTWTATLTGHVIIDQGPTRLTGDRATFHLDSKTGSLETATADLSPDYHIVADSIEKVGEATYRVHHGVFTACDMPDPAWSFSLSDALITLDDYARMKDVAFRVRRLPLLYTPYLFWPTKEDRASGLLVPGVGYTAQRGAYLGLTHYWVTGYSTDLTSNLDLYSGGSIGLGEELRWRPSAEAAGILQGYVIRDKAATDCVPLSQEPSGGEGPCSLSDGSAGVFARRTLNRWKVRLDHVSNDLPYGFRGVVSLLRYSDEQYLQDLERSLAYSSARQVPSFAFLTRNFGDNSVNLRLERNITYYSTTVIQERLPSLEYFRRTSPIGETPLFLSAAASLSYLYIDRGPDLPRGTYGRADIHPTLSLPWKRIPWLSVTATGGVRWTGYTDSTDAAQTSFTGSSYVRRYAEAGLSLVGPSFSRLYTGGFLDFGKFKHVIEPRVDYNYVSEVPDTFRIPTYDDIDLQLGRNQVRYALVNRLLARSADPKSVSAQEIGSLEISQTYAFQFPQTVSSTPGGQPQTPLPQTGPVEGRLRLSPGRLFRLDSQLAYNTHTSRLTAASVAASVSWNANYLNATYFLSRPVLAAPLPPGAVSPNFDQIRLAAGLNLWKSFRVETQWNYDANQHLLLEDRSLLSYRGSCYTVFFELRQLRVPPTPRRDYRVVINLKDIGTLLDLNGSLDRIFGQ
ncbi:MAG: LPS-assembly protein LptD [Thermoanaerobaculia bacterium]